MAASAGPALRELHAELGDRVRFVTIYVREAHPGERVPQPHAAAEKMAHARAYAERDHIDWTVAVDDLEGTVHQRLGRLPDAGYVIDRDGRVVARVLWSSDRRGLRAALRAVVRGTRPHRPERNASVVPFIRGIGAADQVLRSAGQSARHDMLRTMPPFYGLARVASLFRPLSPLGRGVAALALTGAVAWGVTRVIRRLG